MSDLPKHAVEKHRSLSRHIVPASPLRRTVTKNNTLVNIGSAALKMESKVTPAARRSRVFQVSKALKSCGVQRLLSSLMKPPRITRSTQGEINNLLLQAGRIYSLKNRIYTLINCVAPDRFSSISTFAAS